MHAAPYMRAFAMLHPRYKSTRMHAAPYMRAFALLHPRYKSTRMHAAPYMRACFHARPCACGCRSALTRAWEYARMHGRVCMESSICACVHLHVCMEVSTCAQ